MICKDSDKFLEICDKVKEAKGARLTQNILYNYMIAGLYGEQVFTFVSYDKGKMNGCLVLLLTRDILREKILRLLFIWIDAHYPKLLQEFIEFANNKAKELNIKQIVFATDRKEKIIERRLGKFGFKKICITYAKDVM